MRQEGLSSYLKSLIKTTFAAHNPRTPARYLPSRDQSRDVPEKRAWAL